MNEHNEPKSLAEIMAADAAEDDAAREAARPASDSYTGTPCPNCGRIRIYLRRDGRFACEKCEWVSPASSPPERPE